MESINTTFGGGFPAGPARIPTATLRLRGDVRPVIATTPPSVPVQGTALPTGTFDQGFVADAGLKRLVMYPPGSTRTDHDG